MPRPKTSTEAGLAAMNKEHKLQRLEEKLAAGWVPPERKKKEHKRAPDLLEERTPMGIQLTIFHAIATVDGTVRAKELQQFDAGNAQSPGRRSKPAKKTSEQEAKVIVETEEERANKAWLASALG